MRPALALLLLSISMAYTVKILPVNPLVTLGEDANYKIVINGEGETFCIFGTPNVELEREGCFKVNGSFEEVVRIRLIYSNYTCGYVRVNNTLYKVCALEKATIRCNVTPEDGSVRVSCNYPIVKIEGLETSPGIHEVRVYLNVGGEVIPYNVTYYVPVEAAISKREFEKKGFFYITREVLLKNDGNVPQCYLIVVYGEETGVIKYDGVTARAPVQMSVCLKPGERRILVFREVRYTALLALLGLLAIPIGAKYTLPPVRAKKYYYVSSSGGKTRVSVMIKVRGWPKGGRITVVDPLLPIAKNLKFETYDGLVEGNKVIWNLEVKKGETIYLSYNFEIPLRIIGDVKLPKAYLIWKGRKYGIPVKEERF